MPFGKGAALPLILMLRLYSCSRPALKRDSKSVFVVASTFMLELSLRIFFMFKPKSEVWVAVTVLDVANLAENVCMLFNFTLKDQSKLLISKQGTWTNVMNGKSTLVTFPFASTCSLAILTS